MSFENLTPDVVLNAVEPALGVRLTNLIRPLPSYINRVYELQCDDGTMLVGKFYRPGRWTPEALRDEHRFVAECAQAELPVVAPLILQSGNSLGEHDGVSFAVYPRRAGRRFEVTTDEHWRRIGGLVARMHLCGQREPADHRVTLHPQKSTVDDLAYLCDHVLSDTVRDKYRAVVTHIVQVSTPLFEGLECIRIHGDCHAGNILDRMEEGLLLIDFDDMAMGPPVQDLWLLLPERAAGSEREIALFLEGYERFRPFNRASLRCIEALRAMRMVYFAAWQSRQRDDYLFRNTYPDWGTDSFWQREIGELYEQVGEMEGGGW